MSRWSLKEEGLLLKCAYNTLEIHNEYPTLVLRVGQGNPESLRKTETFLCRLEAIFLKYNSNNRNGLALGQRLQKLFTVARRNGLSFDALLSSYDIMLVDSTAKDTEELCIIITNLKNTVDDLKITLREMKRLHLKIENGNKMTQRIVNDANSFIDLVEQWTGSKKKYSHLSRENLIEKLQFRKIENKHQEKKIVDLEEKVNSITKKERNFLGQYREYITNVDEKNDLVLYVLMSVRKTPQLVSGLMYNFCLTQFRFHSRTHEGNKMPYMGGKYSKIELDFWQKVFNECGRRTLDTIRGYEVGKAFLDGNFLGNFVIPNLRVFQKVNSAKGKPYGIKQEMIDNVFAAAEEVKSNFDFPIIFSLNLDETDVGQSKIVISKNGEVSGCVEFSDQIDAINRSRVENGLKAVVPASAVENFIEEMKVKIPLFPEFDFVEPITYSYIHPLEFTIQQLSFHDKDMLLHIQEQRECYERKCHRVIARYVTTHPLPSWEKKKLLHDLLLDEVVDNTLREWLKGDEKQCKAVNALRNYFKRVAMIYEHLGSLKKSCVDILSDIASLDEEAVELYFKRCASKMFELFTDIRSTFQKMYGCLLIKATKLQAFMLADSMRVGSSILGLFMIKEATHQETGCLIEESIRLLSEKNICVQNISFDGGSRSLAYTNMNFVSGHVRYINNHVKNINSINQLADLIWELLPRYIKTLNDLDVFDSIDRMNVYISSTGTEPLYCDGKVRSVWPGLAAAELYMDEWTTEWNGGGTSPMNLQSNCLRQMGLHGMRPHLQNIVVKIYISMYLVQNNQKNSPCDVKIGALRNIYLNMSVPNYINSCENNFYTNCYLPETFQWKFFDFESAVPRTCTVDPDHVMKRMVTHVSCNGFGNVKASAWKTLCDHRSELFPSNWYKRDSQDVELARLFFDPSVSQALKDLGHQEEATFCDIVRNYFDVFDKRNVTMKHRLQYLKDFKNYFLPKVLPYLCNPSNSGGIPTNILGMPIQVVEDLLLNLFGYYARHNWLRELFAAVRPHMSDEDALIIERFIQTNDVENLFSMLKRILRIEGRGQKGQSNPTDVRVAATKLITNAQIMNKNSFKSPTNSKNSYTSKSWGTDEIRTKKRRRSDPYNVPVIPIRKFHQKMQGMNECPTDKVSLVKK